MKFTKSVYVSILLTLMISLKSVALLAQHSFARTHYPSMERDNYVEGMLQLSDGNFVIWGQSLKGGKNSNYWAKLDVYGNVIFERFYNSKSYSDYLIDMLELEDGRLMFGGLAQDQIQPRNPRVSFWSKEGDLLYDSIYPIYTAAGGEIDIMIDCKDKGYVASIGQGNVGVPTPLYFQKTDYNGKRTWYRFVYGAEISALAFFRHKHKDGYIVFNGTSVADLDSTGELRKPMSSAYNSGPNQRGWYLLDVKQRKDGSYVSLTSNDVKFGWRLQFHDTTGAFIGDTLIFPNSQDTMGFGKLVLTADGGYALLGSHIYKIDSNYRLQWCKRLLSNDENYPWFTGVSQAMDSGFYGCFYDATLKDSSGPYGMYVFKTLPDGRIITGLKEQNGRLAFSVFPNPSSDGLFTLSGIPKGARLQLTDMLGRTHLFRYDEVSGALDASGLIKGVYYLQVNTTHATAAHKISTR